VSDECSIPCPKGNGVYYTNSSVDTRPQVDDLLFVCLNPWSLSFFQAKHDDQGGRWTHHGNQNRGRPFAMTYQNSVLVQSSYCFYVTRKECGTSESRNLFSRGNRTGIILISPDSTSACLSSSVCFLALCRTVSLYIKLQIYTSNNVFKEDQ
jgi:hypothetical protein